MNIKTAALSLVCAVGMAGMASAAGLENVTSSVIPGEWTDSYNAAKSYAEANGVPMLLFWSSPGCAKCNKMKTACNTAEFVAWRQSRKIILVFSEGNGTVKAFARNSSGNFPYMVLYWPAGGVERRFTGRKDSIPASGADLQTKLMNYVDSLIGGWINGGADPGSGEIITPPTPVAPVVGPEWKKARNLQGSFYSKDGNLLGRVYLTASKANKGTAKVKAVITGLDGKAMKFAQKKVTVDKTTKGMLASSDGTYTFSITGAQISGSLNLNDGETYEVKPLRTGGSLTDGTFKFTLDTYPETCQAYPIIGGTDFLPLAQEFTSKASKWSFPRKASLRYDSKVGGFVMPATDNPSGLKMTYKESTGYVKGTFTVYAQRKEKSIKRYSAAVTGFMAGNEGKGIVTIKKVGIYSCSISR